MGVLLLDARQLNKGLVSREKYLRDMIQSFRDYGFVRIINHSIPIRRVKQIFELSTRLFSLDSETKLSFVNIADGRPQRGYSAVGVEKTALLHSRLIGGEVDERLTDAREHFDCGSPLDGECRNKWPLNVDGFRDEIESFYFEMETLAADILACIEEGLGSPKGTFNKFITHEKNASELRLNHYPAIAADTLRGGKVSRIWPHFDLGVITLLFTSTVGGLEVEDRKASSPQSFISVDPETEAELIVNTSETLQRWTDDQLLAGLHRVSVPKALRKGINDGVDIEVPERYSIAYLCKADKEAPVGTIPTFQAGEAPRYENMTAAEYHRLRLLAAY